MIFMPEHAALAVVGEGELAEFSGVGAWFGPLGVTFGRGIFYHRERRGRRDGEEEVVS